MPTLDTLPTPALILDRSKLIRNLERMRTAVAGHNVTLRPHLKTAKSVEVARLATAGGSGAITVSTIAEAEYFAAHGFHDILLGVSITPDKLQRLAPLISQGAKVTVVTDRADVAAAVVRAGLPALIEIDSGERRSGVLPDDPELLAIAQALGTSLAGVLTHAGHSYLGHSAEDFARIAEQERSAVVVAAERLRSAGHTVATVSVGSTPTALYAEHLDGVTEVRAGVYMFGDLFQAAIGSCGRDDIAVTVLSSVIGHRRDEGLLLLDAGALALSKDRSTANTHLDEAFGVVWDIDGQPRYGIARVERVYQEHGIAACQGDWPWDELPIDTRVRIAPNHACITSAAYDRYHVVDGGRDVVAEWERCRGW
jgi:D-serine deaminase-like pyridoxal phosphate-dependent protein